MIDEATMTITAADAQRYLGIPASSVRAYASGENPRLHSRGITRTGARLYAVRDLLELRDTTQRRAAHTRPLAQRAPAI